MVKSKKMNNKKYGSVYTPDNLADFVSFLLINEIEKSGLKVETVLDPACGEGALLKSFSKSFNGKCRYIGIDNDIEAYDFCIENYNEKFSFEMEDFLLPSNLKTDSCSYWINKLGEVSLIISNPPWSKERKYSNSKLKGAGFELNINQYDAYILFIELSLRLLKENGIMAFIIPDSLFDTQNSYIRKYLLENSELKVIARLGEKLFTNINRATSVILCKKTKNQNNITKCFRLTSQERKCVIDNKISLNELFNNNSHDVLQNRFLKNRNFSFDIDVKSTEEKLITKLESHGNIWNKDFKFGRGIEISKSGIGVECPICKKWQPILKKEITQKRKCIYCSNDYIVEEKNVSYLISDSKSDKNIKIFVGENLQRYKTTGNKYINNRPDIIDFKSDLFNQMDMIMVRKTGLGIYASLNNNILTTQSIYILKPLKKDIAYYYLALLNSRLIYYYYMMKFGENEWKSHPYLTKSIIFSLPLIKYRENEKTKQISDLAKMLTKSYLESTDLMLENSIFELYGINENERKLIIKRLQQLPKELTAISDMRIMEK